MARPSMFSDEEVINIIILYNKTKHLPNSDPEKWTMRRLGKHYHCSRQTIFNIIKRNTYEWVSVS